MAYSHVAHDCHVGSNVIFANNATLAGHVEVGDFSTIGAFSAVHQFCRVGEHAFIGGDSMCTQDVLPFVKTVGSRPTKTYGINSIGLQRKGFSPDAIEALQRAYRILTRSKLKLEDALAKIEADLVSKLPEERNRSLMVQCGGRRPRRPALCLADSDNMRGPGPARAPATTLNLLRGHIEGHLCSSGARANHKPGVTRR